MANIGVLGAGTWGMALSRMLCLSGHTVTVWSALEQEVKEYAATRRHPNLPEMIIPDAIVFTGDIAGAVSGRDILLFAVPSVFVRSTARAAAPFAKDDQIIVDVAKGIEPDTLMTLTEVIRDEMIKAGKTHVRMVALSGPTHAEEVAMDLPSTIVSASDDDEAAAYVQDICMNTCMRVYTNSDVKGVELCGAMKNIIALASGMCLGLGYGDNTKAALMTRGMAEITRLGLAMGCQPSTFAGLAGIGDLIVTATSVHSRNNRAGYLIGQGKTAEEAKKEVGMVVEGINALPAAISLAEKYQVEMPIVEAVNRIHHGENPADTVGMLMGRKKKTE
jgi:glycerol-3-phosphate dehydrogenase (NAD(P)+)